MAVRRWWCGGTCYRTVWVTAPIRGAGGGMCRAISPSGPAVINGAPLRTGPRLIWAMAGGMRKGAFWPWAWGIRCKVGAIIWGVMAAGGPGVIFGGGGVGVG